MSLHESIKWLIPKLLRTKFNSGEYDELMNRFDGLMREKLDAENIATLTAFIANGIDNIYSQFDRGSAIHPETLNILIRAIQVYNNANEKPYPFPIFENEDDPNDPTVSFMNNIVRRAAQREKLFGRTRGEFTKAQLEAQRYASDEKAKEGKTNMEEVDGGSKRKRTKRRYKRKHQRKSKRVKKVIH